MKLVKGKIRKYYKYVPWTQPVATADITAITGGNMVITASSYYSQSGEYPWKGFNGEYSGTSWCLDVQPTGWWKIQFPYRINVTGLKFYQRNGASTYRTTTARFYTNADKTTPIGDVFNPPATDYGSVVVNNIPSSGIYTDTIYLDITAGVTAAGMGMLDITASTIEESTSSDYDFYEDVDDYKIIKETIREYYKYVSWTQPVLTGYTTSTDLGNIIVSATSESGGTCQAWKIMIGSVSSTVDNDYWQLANSLNKESLTLIFPYKLKISNLKITTRPRDNYIRNVGVFNSKGTQIGSTVNCNAALTEYTLLSNGSVVTDTLIITVFAGSGDNSWFGLQNLQITAQRITDGTSSDYDFYEDVDVYEAVK